MTRFFTLVIALCMALYLLVLLVDAVRRRRANRLLIEGGLLALAAIVFNLTTGFPKPADRTSFGGAEVLTAMGVMLVCIVLGMVAQYVYYLKGEFSWRAFLKPLFVSPIVLTPLLGAVQGLEAVEGVQLVSFGFLAFQNGFFWRVIFERAEAGVGR